MGEKSLSLKTKVHEIRKMNVAVEYAGVPFCYARACGRICSVAREGVSKVFGINMTRHLNILIVKQRGGDVRLFTDGRTRICMFISNRKNLCPPKKSRIHLVYGLAHEVAHIGMYRFIWRNVKKLPKGTGEGWAHYAASTGLVPYLNTHLGLKAWPEHYDYFTIEGPARFKQQISGNPNRHRQPRLWAAKKFNFLGEKYGQKVLGKTMSRILRDHGPSKRLMSEIETQLKLGIL